MNELFMPAAISFATTMATKGAQAPADTFNEAWKYVFGGIDTFFKRKNFERQHNLELYFQSFAQKTESIPAENIQEPDLSIIGPALEASKYYIEEPVIREMFANLLSASFDSTKNEDIRHCFTDIIKQLSPFDAKVLSNDYLQSQGGLAGAYIQLFTTDNSFNTFTPRLVENFLDNQKECALSIDNLIRLGLLEVPFGDKFQSQTRYESFEPIINLYKDQYVTHRIKMAIDTLSESMTDEEIAIHLGLSLEDIRKYRNMHQTVDISKHIIQLTELGKSFIKICVD